MPQIRAKVAQWQKARQDEAVAARRQADAKAEQAKLRAFCEEEDRKWMSKLRRDPQCKALAEQGVLSR